MKLVKTTKPARSARRATRRNRLRLLELEGQVEFHVDWDYKKLRGKR